MCRHLANTIKKQLLLHSRLVNIVLVGVSPLVYLQYSRSVGIGILFSRVIVVHCWRKNSRASLYIRKN